jgi:hypothetical protein
MRAVVFPGNDVFIVYLTDTNVHKQAHEVLALFTTAFHAFFIGVEFVEFVSLFTYHDSGPLPELEEQEHDSKQSTPAGDNHEPPDDTRLHLRAEVDVPQWNGSILLVDAALAPARSLHPASDGDVVVVEGLVAVPLGLQADDVTLALRRRDMVRSVRALLVGTQLAVGDLVDRTVNIHLPPHITNIRATH